ncbi:MAG TPA: acyl-CoA dehydrogenase [Mycobacteriales bacterium]|nr:acyl-CoA dehydrogenase [Mycobacteriales bacterium]
MHFALSGAALELRGGLRDLLAGACPPSTVRAAWPGGDDGAVQSLWRALGDFGLPAVLVPETDGGLGLDDVVTVAALEEAGRAGVPGPLVETSAVAAPLLAAAGALPKGVLDGAVRIAVQRREVVPYAQRADAFLQLDESGARLLARADADVTAVDTVDGARAAGRVAGVGAPVDVDPSQVRKAIHRGALGTAAFLVGLSHRMLAMTVEYVKSRTQFGVPVGSFQAVQHPLADALVGVEFASPAVLRAAQSMVDDEPDTALHVALAKTLASDAAERTARTCIQAHGAMGYTVEYDLHLFAKRAWALAADWGSASEHRADVARTLLEAR